MQTESESIRGSGGGGGGGGDWSWRRYLGPMLHDIDATLVNLPLLYVDKSHGIFLGDACLSVTR